jgi:hypothetical protein
MEKVAKAKTEKEKEKATIKEEESFPMEKPLTKPMEKAIQRQSRKEKAPRKGLTWQALNQGLLQKPGSQQPPMVRLGKILHGTKQISTTNGTMDEQEKHGTQ